MRATIRESFVVARPKGVRIRTRLKPSPEEEQMLRRIGEHLGRLQRLDLVGRLSLGDVPVKGQQRASRKKGLTPGSSSRWAGSITRFNNDQYRLSLMALDAEIDGLTQSPESRLPSSATGSPP